MKRQRVRERQSAIGKETESGEEKAVQNKSQRADKVTESQKKRLKVGERNRV